MPASVARRWTAWGRPRATSPGVPATCRRRAVLGQPGTSISTPPGA